MNITIVGLGYVGLSLATLLSRKHKVIGLEIDSAKINKINDRICPIQDKCIEEYFQNHRLNLLATNDKKSAYSNADFVIICTPTNYDETTNQFDVSSIKIVIEDSLKFDHSSPIIIKSTVPVGFTEELQKKYLKDNIIFSPEFLREGLALYDNLNPSRIIIGSHCSDGQRFSELLKSSINMDPSKVPVEFMKSHEAEAVKLFANTYLAMRIAFFNELDTYCEQKNYDTRKIINGISHDNRIGKFYNNPSFGYGGYCLPKDTQQMLKNFEDTPNNIIKAVVEANVTRKKFISDQIIKMKPNCIGIYRLTMKEGSDNFRESAIIDVLKNLKDKCIKTLIYEPSLNEDLFLGYKVCNDLSVFKNESDIIVANRFSKDLENVRLKVYTRDIFNEN